MFPEPALLPASFRPKIQSMLRRPFLILLLSLSSAVQAAEVVDGSVGQVGEHVVTSREVWVSNFIERWEMGRKLPDPQARVPKSDWKPAVKSDAFKQIASAFMLELMVSQEAENFSVAEVSVADIKKEIPEFLKSMEGHSDWSKFEVSTGELEKFIQRKHRSENFLKFKTESAGVTVSDDEAKAYFEKNRLKFGRLPFTQFKDSIKEVLARQRLEERLKDWFEVLRRKYRVRVLGASEA